MRVRGGKTDTAQRELELELIQSQIAQKPVLRGDVGARASRVARVKVIKIVVFKMDREIQGGIADRYSTHCQGETDRKS